MFPAAVLVATRLSVAVVAPGRINQPWSIVPAWMVDSQMNNLLANCKSLLNYLTRAVQGNSSATKELQESRVAGVFRESKVSFILQLVRSYEGSRCLSIWLFSCELWSGGGVEIGRDRDRVIILPLGLSEREIVNSLHKSKASKGSDKSRDKTRARIQKWLLINGNLTPESE